MKLAQTSGARIYELVVGIVTLAITARLLGPAGRGFYAAILTWVQLFFTLGYLSLGQVALHRAAQTRGTDWLGPTLASLLVLNAIISSAGWLIALGIYQVSAGKIFNNIAAHLLVLGFLALPLLIWQQYGRSLLLAVDRLELVNRARIAGTTLGLIVLVLLLWLGWDITGALAANTVSQAIIACGGMLYLLRQSEGALRPDAATITALLKGGARLHLHAIGAVLIISVGTISVNHYLGAVATGYYSLAVRLVAVLIIIPESASLVLYSKMAQLGPEEIWPYQRKMLPLLLLLMAGAGATAALVAPLAIPLIAGEEFMPAVGIFQVMLVGLIGTTFAMVMACQWIGRGLFWETSAITLSLGLLSICAHMLLVPRYGVYGAAWAGVGIYSFYIVISSGLAIWCEAGYRARLREEERYS